MKLLQKLTRIERRRKKRQIVFKLFLLMTIISLIIGFILKSDFFRVEKIEVFGNKILNVNKIVEFSNIGKGENIFKIDTKSIREKVEELPYVKEANIKIKLPDTVIIDIIEREETLAVKNISSYLIIDNEGYILKQVEDIDVQLPIVLGLKTGNMQLGSNIFSIPKVEVLVDFIEEGYRLNLLKLIKEIDVEELNEVKIRLNNSIDIAFGSLDNVKYKLSMLEEILKDLEKKEIKSSKIIMNRGSHPIIIIDD